MMISSSICPANELWLTYTALLSIQLLSRNKLDADKHLWLLAGTKGVFFLSLFTYSFFLFNMIAFLFLKKHFIHRRTLSLFAPHKSNMVVYAGLYFAFLIQKYLLEISVHCSLIHCFGRCMYHVYFVARCVSILSITCPLINIHTDSNSCLL